MQEVGTLVDGTEIAVSYCEEFSLGDIYQRTVRLWEKRLEN